MAVLKIAFSVPEKYDSHLAWEPFLETARTKDGGKTLRGASPPAHFGRGGASLNDPSDRSTFMRMCVSHEPGCFVYIYTTGAFLPI